MKQITVLVAILLFLVTPGAISFNDNVYKTTSSVHQDDGIINITVLEVWSMLESEADGVQVPVDDRTFQEYFTERLATPHSYDKPILYPLQLIERPFFMNIFFFLFEDKEIIIYCRSSNRSYIAGNILFENGYQGVVYNMVGGINAWKAAGLPTVKGFGTDDYLDVM